MLAFNLQTRERLLLATSTDTGHTWRSFATLDTGHEAGQTSDAYPTVIVSGSELLTVWSTYDGGPRNKAASYYPDKVASYYPDKNSGQRIHGFANIKLARTRIP